MQTFIYMKIRYERSKPEKCLRLLTFSLQQPDKYIWINRSMKTGIQKLNISKVAFMLDLYYLLYMVSPVRMIIKISQLLWKALLRIHSTKKLRAE